MQPPAKSGESTGSAGPELMSRKCRSKNKYGWVPSVAIKAWFAEGSHNKGMTDNVFLSTYWLSRSEKDTRMMSKYTQGSAYF